MKRFRKFASNKNFGKVAKDKGEEEEESLEWIVSSKTLKGSDDPINTKTSENLQSFNDVASIPKKKVTDLEIRKNFSKKLKKSTDAVDQEINEDVDKIASSKKLKKRKHAETFVSYVETNNLGNNEYKPMRKLKKQKMGVDNPQFDVEGNLSINDDNETSTVNNNEFELKTKKKYKHFDKQGIDNPALNDKSDMTTNATHTKRRTLNTSSDRIFRPSDWINKSTNEHIPKHQQFKSTNRKGYNETPYQNNKGFVNNGFDTRATEIFGNPSNERSNLNENIKTISNTIDRYHAEVENDINEAKIDHYEENVEINTNYGEEDMLVNEMRMQKRPTPNVNRHSRGRFNNNYYNQNNQFRNTNMNANRRFSYDSNTNRRFSNQHVNRRSGPIMPQTRNMQNFIHRPKFGNQFNEFNEGYDTNQQYVDETNDFQQEGFYPNQYQHEEFHQNNFQQQQFYPNDYQQQGFNPNHFEEEFQPNQHDQFQEQFAHEEFYPTDFNEQTYNTNVQYNEQPNNNFLQKIGHLRGFSHGKGRYTAVKRFDKPRRSFETTSKPYTQKQEVFVGDVDSSLEHHETVDEGTKLSFKQATFTASQPWARKEGNYAKKSYKHLIKGDVVVGFKDANLHEIKGYAAHKKVPKRLKFQF